LRISEISDSGKGDEEDEGQLMKVPLDVDPRSSKYANEEFVYIWDVRRDEKDGKARIDEVKGNVNLHLVAKYYYRYDPPRTASTGGAQTPQGDHHLFKGGVEIAAWNDSGKARHGFESGTKIPNKALKHLQKKFGDVRTPPNGILEQLVRGVESGKLLVEVKST
tara:strand:- start:526 stop:1017 length:492 start_codon:yes stop_codon:yes gene_type:complete